MEIQRAGSFLVAVMAENEEFIREFLDESYENLDQLDQDFIALETAPHDHQRLASIFRTIHTIKGTSGFFGFSKLGAIAHAGESVLSRLREGTLVLDPAITTGLLDCVDAIRKVLKSIETTGQEGNSDFRALNEQLAKISASPKVSPQAKSSGSTPVTDSPATRQASIAPVAVTVKPPAPPQTPSTPPLPLPTAKSPPSTPPIAVTSEGTLKPIAEATSGENVVAPATPAKSSEAPPEREVAKASTAEGSIRVDVAVLDRLMNLVGELVLARNQLLQFTRYYEDRTLQGVTHRVNQITSELQQGVMKTRMQPISGLWSKLPRVVRDLAATCKKEVQLEMCGQETELDRSLIEAIRDPLTHLIRNSIDHGIESPEGRLAVGKPSMGMLRLSAYHEGGLVNIEIIDDGQGIAVDRIKRRALERGLITEQDAAIMSENELIQLIFMPGFSTAEKVTDISGRGVGMDVVKTNIEKIGGSIDILNRPGQGTNVRVKIPLTLAIVPALIISTNEQIFAVPQASLTELLTLEGEQAAHAIEMVHDIPVYRLRGKLLPLIFLDRMFGAPEDQSPLYRDKLHIVVVQAADVRFGLIVDEIHNTEEIVVKPLHQALTSMRVFSGATIMGDGQVALILDVTGLAWQAGMSSDESSHARISDRSIENATTLGMIYYSSAM